MSSSSSELNSNGNDFDVLQQSLLIRAGAGAGKTTMLIQTFVDLCQNFELKWKRLPRVAITTFTRKATQEVKERLSIKALEKKDEKLFQHINKKSAVHISTIHGLLTLFIQDNADLLGLPQNVKIMDQNVNKKNLKKLVRQCLKQKPEYLEILEHYTFIKVVDLVIQTTEYIQQIPEIQPLTITELKQETLVYLQTLSIQLTEILAYRPSAPETWNEYFEYLSAIQKLAQEGQIEELIAATEAEPAKPRWNKKKLAFEQTGHDLIEKFRDDLDLSLVDSISYFEQHDQLNQLFFKLAVEVHALDQERKRSTGQITINDLELFSLQLVRHHPKAVADFSDHFDYYMIDEFQDTSPVQVEILDALISGKPYFIVGDPQQSIYLFRGARSEVFLLKQKLASENTGSLKLKFLDTNYRSQPSLMLFINDYFSHMSSQFEPMKTNPLKSSEPSEIVFVQAENEALAVLQQVNVLLDQNISPQHICVLSRKNSSLIKIAALAQRLHIPVQLQMSAGFDQKREILDLIAMLKFLVNPHDNENLILLLRSPWAYLSDSQIAQASGKDRSLWHALNQMHKSLPAVQRLSQFFSNYQDVGVSEAFTQLIQISGFLDFSSALDASGKREANFWKFFAHLKNAEMTSGFSLSRYLNDNFQFLQTDLGSSQSEAIPVAQPDRVSLMTIHASKGLEFPYVIIVGCSDEPLLTKQMPLAVGLEQKRLSLAPFVISESKTVVCRWAQNIRRDFNRKEADEHERLLYVAMTRAEKGLVLVAEKRSRVSQSSWKNKSIWPDVGESLHEKYKLISLIAATTLEPRPQAQRAKGSIKEKLNLSMTSLSSQSVTESLEPIQAGGSGKTDYNAKILDLLKAKKGTDMHRLFESLQTSMSGPHVLLDLQKNMTPEQRKSIQYLLDLEVIPLKQILKSGFAEWGFGIKTKTGVLQGQIDLWGQVDNDVYILDYKTGSTGYADKAFQQLSFYGYCLYRMKLISPDLNLHLVVTYPLEQKTLVKTFTSQTEFEKSAPLKVSELF